MAHSFILLLHLLVACLHGRSYHFEPSFHVLGTDRKQWLMASYSVQLVYVQLLWRLLEVGGMYVVRVLKYY